jgi:hypothetical protein
LKITITSTEKLTHIGPTPVRVWEGITEQGTKCLVFVHRLMISAEEDPTEFDKELEEQLPPGRVFDLRQIL